jgi:hypothetical protein
MFVNKLIKTIYIIFITKYLSIVLSMYTIHFSETQKRNATALPVSAIMLIFEILFN